VRFQWGESFRSCGGNGATQIQCGFSRDSAVKLGVSATETPQKLDASAVSANRN